MLDEAEAKVDSAQETMDKVCIRLMLAKEF